MTDPAGLRPDSARSAHPPAGAASTRPGRASLGPWLAGSAALALVAVAAVAALLALRDAPGDERLFSSRLGEGPHLVFAEFGPDADTLYTAPASNPTERTAVGRVAHAAGWGINPAPALAGSLLAYTALPEAGAARRDAPAELWVLDIETRNRTRLARDADLLSPPLIDGETVVYRSSSAGGRQDLVRVDLDTRARSTVHTYEGGFGIFPVGLVDGETVIFAAYSPAGTDIYGVRPGEDTRHIAHASDHVARDLRVSPDGALLSYVAPEEIGERYLHRLRVIDIASGEPAQGALHGDEAQDASAAEQFAPVWSPDGASLTVGREPTSGRAASAVVRTTGGAARALPAPATGFDVPLGWSADARYLAVRSFSGSGAFEPGLETMVVIDIDGTRHELRTETELLYLGWYRGG